MRILIAASGSFGDVYPFVAIGKALAVRGHHVELLANPYFEDTVKAAGLELIPLGKVDDYTSVVENPDLMDENKAMSLVAEMMAKRLPESYAALEQAARDSRQDTVYVNSTLSFAPRLLRETKGVTLVTVHLAPSVFRSNERPPQLSSVALPSWLPPWFFGLMWRIVDRFIADRLFCPSVNRFRQTLGLSPLARLFHQWIHEADALVGLFPEWFAPRQNDWPAKLSLTGFPLYDQASRGLSQKAQDFLNAGPPPIVFTSGTASANEADFFGESVRTCQDLGSRAMLLSRHLRHIPKELPPGMAHFPHEPFSLLLKQAAAVVHHGGIGTASQGLAASIPQLVRPMAFDQFDNAAHLERLGVSKTLPVSQYRRARVSRALRTLFGSEAVRTACAGASARLQNQDAIDATCEVILNSAKP